MNYIALFFYLGPVASEGSGGDGASSGLQALPEVEALSVSALCSSQDFHPPPPDPCCPPRGLQKLILHGGRAASEAGSQGQVGSIGCWMRLGRERAWTVRPRQEPSGSWPVT